MFYIPVAAIITLIYLIVLFFTNNLNNSHILMSHVVFWISLLLFKSIRNLVDDSGLNDLPSFIIFPLAPVGIQLAIILRGDTLPFTVPFFMIPPIQVIMLCFAMFDFYFSISLYYRWNSVKIFDFSVTPFIFKGFMLLVVPLLYFLVSIWISSLFFQFLALYIFLFNLILLIVPQ